jgi:low affinity Fe/Cu permease
MSSAKSFTVGNATYNAARASAVAQDEVLSLLTQALIQRLVAAGKEGIEADESVLFPMMMAMPYQLKQKIDELIMSRISVAGRDDFVTIKDLDAIDYNRLRAKVLRWNLEGFFTYWAEESRAAVEAMQSQVK